MLKWLAALALILLVSGCISKGPGASTPGTPSQPIPTASPHTIPRPPDLGAIASLPARPAIILSSCRGLAADYLLPKDLSPAHPPAGWNGSSDNFDLVDGIFLAYSCHRVSVGPFERPASLVLAWHTNVDPPTKCAPVEPSTKAAYLYAILVNDSAISTFLKSEYGMPAHYAEMQISADAPGDAIVRTTASFGVPGLPTSNFQLIDSNTSAARGQSTPVSRLFWPNQSNGISYLNFTETYTTDNLGAPIAIGNIESPLIYTALDEHSFAGVADPIYSENGSAEIYSFGDVKCEKPL